MSISCQHLWRLPSPILCINSLASSFLDQMSRILFLVWLRLLHLIDYPTIALRTPRTFKASFFVFLLEKIMRTTRSLWFTPIKYFVRCHAIALKIGLRAFTTHNLSSCRSVSAACRSGFLSLTVHVSVFRGMENRAPGYRFLPLKKKKKKKKKKRKKKKKKKIPVGMKQQRFKVTKNIQP